MKKLIRESVFTIDLYEPGKSVETIKRELGLEKEFSKLASNENPLGPSPLAIETIKKSLADSSLYPDGSCHDNNIHDIRRADSPHYQRKHAYNSQE